MRDETRMLLESMGRLFEDHCTKPVADAAEAGTFPDALWQAVSDSGVPVEEFIVAGGLAQNALLMQIYSDVTRLPLSIIDSEQGPALGAAIHAAVAAGAYEDVPTAAKQMGKVRRHVYVPDEDRAKAYDALFDQYVALHDHFGRTTTTMRRLKAIRRDAVARRTAATAPVVSA